MRRWLPYPVMSVGFLVMWLLLNQSLAPLQVLLGAALGVLLPRLMVRLDAPPLRLRRPVAIVGLAGAAFLDIFRSNVAVAAIILAPSRRKGAPGFVQIPLELESLYALSALATIITATPGTLWVRYDAAGRELTIHVLDLVDADTWVRTIKERYEKPLLEVFG